MYINIKIYITHNERKILCFKINLTDSRNLVNKDHVQNLRSKFCEENSLIILC